MARARDHKAEYARRIARGVAKGLTKSQARGHAAARGTAAGHGELPASTTPLWAAYRSFQDSKNLSAAARAHGIAPERLRQLVKGHGLAKREGRRWISTDRLPRRVLIYSKRKELELTVGDYANAALAGAYWHARGRFLETNDLEVLAPFVGRSVKDIKGRLHPLETDPNTIHRLAATGSPAFHEVYRVIAPQGV